MTTKSHERSIEICGRCKGTGYEITVNRLSGHEDEAVRIECKKCEGSGRLMVETITTTTPYDETWTTL